MLATSGNPQRGGSVATTGGGEASGGGLQRTAAARRGRLGQRSQEWPSVAQPYVSAAPSGKRPWRTQDYVQRCQGWGLWLGLLAGGLLLQSLFQRPRAPHAYFAAPVRGRRAA